MTDFTVVSNSILRDERLSYRAIGVLLEILSRPSNWEPDPTEMSARHKEGRNAIYDCFGELEAAGYLVREQVRDDGGRLRTRSTFYASPQVPPITGNRLPVPPAQTGKPAGPTDYRESVGKDEPCERVDNANPQVPPITGYRLTGNRSTGNEEEELKEELQPTTFALASLDADDGAAPMSVPVVANGSALGKIAPTTKRGCRLPEPFPVDERMKKWFAENARNVDGFHEHSQFCDYWWSASGSRATKVDWFRAWCVWMRKSAKDAEMKSSRYPTRLTPDEKFKKNLALVDELRMMEGKPPLSANGHDPGPFIRGEVIRRDIR